MLCFDKKKLRVIRLLARKLTSGTNSDFRRAPIARRKRRKPQILSKKLIKKIYIIIFCISLVKRIIFSTFSWLLSKHPMFVRTSQDVYLEKATQFIGKVVEQVKDLQFYTAAGEKGGPIIMTQVK